MLRLASLLLGIALLAHGGAGISQAVRNRQLTTITCPQLAMSAPKARWLRVTGCEIDYTHPAITASGSRVTEIYFGMRVRGAGRDSPVPLIVATRDPQALAVTQQALANGTPVDDEAFTVAMLRVVGILRAAREVDGYARGGLIERMITRRALAEFEAPLSSAVIVVDLHARPPFAIPGSEAGAGLVLLIAAAALWRRRAAAALSVQTAPEPGAATGPDEVAEVEPAAATLAIAEPRTAIVELSDTRELPVVVPDETSAAFEAPAAAHAAPILERRLPPAMLLNLPPSASSNQIETAPPLGNQQEVAARIANVLGPFTDHGGGKYSATGDGWRLDFDLGRDDAVWTATVDARGSDAALEALDHLVRETSWRVFVPRLGTFR